MFSIFRSRASHTEPDIPTEVARNIRFLYLEIAFASVLSAILLFNRPFAVRLGASNELLAFLASAPALVAAILSVPLARFLQRRTHRGTWVFNSLFILRLGYGVLALIPALFVQDTATWLVMWIVALGIPTIFFTNGFQALLADMIPEDRRALVFARRQVIWSVGMVITSALAGQWLDANREVFPGNYQLMYLFGFVVVLGSMYYLWRLKLPPRSQGPSALTRMLPTARQATPDELIEKPVSDRRLRRMLLNMSVYFSGIYLLMALIEVYYINVLRATDAWLGLNGAVGSAGVVVGYVVWERLLRRRSFTWALRRASLVTWLFPVGVALVPDLNFILLVNFIVNCIHPGVDLTLLNIVMKLSNSENRTLYLSWYNTALNAMMFISPLVGTALAGPLGIPAVFLISGVLRIVGGVLYSVNPVREDPDKAT
jgi:MFS family permease